MKSRRLAGFLFLFLVLCIDRLDLLTNEIHIVLQLLYLTIHLVDEAVALLAAGIKETEIVLIGLYLLLEGLILTEQTGSLVIEGILSAFCHLLEILFEVVQTALGNADVQILVELIKHGMILLEDLVFLLEGNVADGIVLLNELLHLLLNIVAGLLSYGLELLDHLTLFVEVGMLFIALTCSSGITGLKEFVTGTEELCPQLIA